MKVMVDLNVVLDVIQKREPHFGASASVLASAARGDIAAAFPSHCLTTLYYIIARHAGRSTADRGVDWVLSKLTIHVADHMTFLRARCLDMEDFEDAVVAATAETSRCRYIVTRNAADFGDSPVPALTPEEFIVRMDEEP